MPIFRGTGGSGESSTDAYASEVAISAQTATTKANEASASAAAAATSASNAAGSEASVAADASTASTAASNAQTAQTAAEAAQTASEAAQTAAETAQTAAELAETNAETAETNAETAESNASASATAAASSATSAATSATTATTQATAASTSATNAADSATDAQTAQTAAEAAQAAAEAAQEAIDGLYLGALSSNPTVDLNGDPVTAGDWYFNTVDNSTRIYDGTNWDSINPNLVNDSTPQLGGNLDVNGQSIVSASNGDINITPNGTGNVSLGNFTFDTDQTVGAGQDNYILTYDNASGNISLEAGVSAGISDVVEDTTPQLGGTLDANGNNIDMGTNVITDAKVGQWDTAYGWGDHSAAGYITGNETITLTGAVTGSGTTSIATTLSTIDGGTY